MPRADCARLIGSAPHRAFSQLLSRRGPAGTEEHGICPKKVGDQQTWMEQLAAPLELEMRGAVKLLQ